MALEWRVANFERGFTSNYVNGPRNTGQKMDNVIITRNRKLQSRPGSTIFDDTSVDVQQIPPGSQRIQFIKEHEGVLFEYSEDSIYYRNGSVFSELLGPANSNPAFGTVGTTASRNSADQWQGHLYTTIDEYVRPRKIYTDETGSVEIRTMGLPSPGEVRGLSTAIALANGLKTSFNAHVSDVGEHNSADTAVTAPNASTIDSLVVLVNDLKDRYIEHNQDAINGGPVHLGVSNNSLKESDDVVTLTQAINMLNDIKAKYNAHDADATSHTTGSTHQNATPDATKDFTITPTAGAGSYLYGVCYKYTYRVGNTTYIDRSPIQVVSVDSATLNITLSDIPNLANSSFGTFESWDTVNIVKEIYRTEDAGTILKKSGEIDNLTTTYLDDVADSDLGLAAYTTGGALDNDPAPLAKYLVEANDVVWYANVKEDSEEKPFRIRHSIPLAPDACPESFNVDLDAPITGISAVGIFPVVFTEDKTYRLEGQVDATGRGFIRKRVIDETVGCVSNNGIVQVKDGVYFPSKDGFYFTNGLQTTKISNHLNENYAELVATEANKKRIFGVHDPENELVFWAVTSDSTATENDEIWVLDPYWGFPNGQGTFTTWSYGANGMPTALEVIDGDLVRADSRGYTFKHSDSAGNTDPVIDTGENPEDWGTKQVIWDYISSAFTFGSEFQRKWVTRLLVTLKSITNTSIQPGSINDDSGAVIDLKEIRSRNVFEWGDPEFVWGDPNFVWNAPDTENSIRRFPRRGLRCTYKQVRLTNSQTIVANSDNFGLLVIDSAALTATLASGTFSSFDFEDFELVLASGDTFTITAATSTVLTLQDPNSLLVDGNETGWIIRGFRKDEQLNLEGYTVLYDFFGESNKVFRTGDDGANA